MRTATLSLFLTVAALSACASESTEDAAGAGGNAGNAMHGGGQGGAKATLGRNDTVAKHACDAWAGKLTDSVATKTVNAVQRSDYAELAEAKLTVDGATLYTINLPPGKESWVAIDENFWTATLGFFASKGVAYEVLNSDMNPESDGPLQNGACPDADPTDYRVFFMHWTPATIRFSAEGPRQVKFMIMRDEAKSVPAM